MNHLCQICKKVQATIHLTDIHNSVKKEVHMCEGCAAKNGFNLQSTAGLPHLLGLAAKGKQSGVKPAADETSCPNCGMKWSDFRSRGRLGCSDDYRVFREKLEPMLAEIHGYNLHHVGKNPATLNEEAKIRKLINIAERKLKVMVAQENYEVAVALRDELVDLKKRLDRQKKND